MSYALCVMQESVLRLHVFSFSFPFFYYCAAQLNLKDVLVVRSQKYIENNNFYIIYGLHFL